MKKRDDLPTLLRVQRAARKWKQERASLALGWSFNRYRRIEGAMARPTAEQIEQIAQVFDLSERVVRSAVAATTFLGAGSGEAASVA
jgi:transcriptional regulator with XRE-family HTH domain